MDKCPKCSGVVQCFETVDCDDKIIKTEYRCKRKYFNKRKKGCGYISAPIRDKNEK